LFFWLLVGSYDPENLGFSSQLDAHCLHIKQDAHRLLYPTEGCISIQQPMKHYEEQTEKDKKNKDNKEQQHMTIQQTDQLADDPEPTDNVWSSISMTQFNGCQIQEQPNDNNNNKYKDLIVLDSAANVDVFNNPQLVNNIKIAPSPIKVGTNNGSKSLNLTAQSHGRNSTVWFDNTAPTNTYSLAALKKDKTVNKIVFDSSKEDAFIVHLKNGRKTLYFEQ
jgi:hypothetical protein